MRFAIGDIHACIKSLKSMVEEKIRPMKGDQLIFMGDYIDRGPDGKAVLDYLMELEQTCDCYFLRGNHEEMMLDAANGPEEFRHWILNNGDTTLLNFGIANYRDLQEKALSMIPENYLAFIKNTRYYLKSEKDCFLVHAGVNYDLPDPLEDKKAMVWERNIKYDEDFLSGRKLIHGHTPQPLENIQLQLTENSKIVNLDAGCVYKDKKGLGNLVALNLDQWKLLVQENID